MKNLIFAWIWQSSINPAIRTASRRELRFYEMMVTANMAVIQIRISEAEFENPDIKMKWPCQWLTRLNGPLDPWTEQMRFLKPTKMLMPTQYSQVTFHIFFLLPLWNSPIVWLLFMFPKSSRLKNTKFIIYFLTLNSVSE